MKSAGAISLTLSSLVDLSGASLALAGSLLIKSPSELPVFETEDSSVLETTSSLTRVLARLIEDFTEAFSVFTWVTLTEASAGSVLTSTNLTFDFCFLRDGFRMADLSRYPSVLTSCLTSAASCLMFIGEFCFKDY